MYLSNSELEHIHKYPVMLTSKQNLQPNKHANAHYWELRLVLLKQLHVHALLNN